MTAHLPDEYRRHVEDSIPPLRQVVETVALLRAPGGCPWDQEQTHASLATHVVEEAYELAEAIDSEDPAQVLDELGDILVQVLLHSQVAYDNGTFGLADVAKNLNEKLIRRHPHVFAQVEVTSTSDVIANWDKIKTEESASDKTKNQIPKALPALRRATKVLRRSDANELRGTDTNESKSFRDKVAATRILLDRIETDPRLEADPSLAGELLMAVANVVRLAGVDPEDALRKHVAQYMTKYLSDGN